MHLMRHDTIYVDDRKGWIQNGLRGVEGANVCIGDLALFGELAALAAWVRNYAARGARGCNVRKGYFARIGGARMGGEGSTSFIFSAVVTLCYIVSQTANHLIHSCTKHGTICCGRWVARSGTVQLNGW